MMKERDPSTSKIHPFKFISRKPKQIIVFSCEFSPCKQIWIDPLNTKAKNIVLNNILRTFDITIKAVSRSNWFCVGLTIVRRRPNRVCALFCIVSSQLIIWMFVYYKIVATLKTHEHIIIIRICCWVWEWIAWNTMRLFIQLWSSDVTGIVRWCVVLTPDIWISALLCFISSFVFIHRIWTMKVNRDRKAKCSNNVIFAVEQFTQKYTHWISPYLRTNKSLILWRQFLFHIRLTFALIKPLIKLN